MAKPSFVSCKVLVVDHDPTSLSTVSAMLQHWLYDVLTVESTVEALATIRNQQDFDLVVTELHMPEMNGLTLQKKINEEFNNLPVIVMSYDDQLSVKLQNLKSGVVFYIVKPVKLDDLKNVWQFAVTSKTGKSVWQRKAASSRVTWTYELHNKFIEAISYIGLDKAVPSNILEFMNVPGLNREQVASHLQRYRNAEKGTSGALENLRTTLASGTGHSSMTLQDAQMRQNQRPTITTTSSCWNSSGLEDMESINTLGLNGSYGLMNGTAGAFGQLAPGESSSSAGIGDIGNYQFPSYAFAVANEQAINTSLMPPLSSQQHYCFGNSDPGSLLFEQSDHQFLHHQAEVNLPINQSQNPDLDGDYGVGVDASWDQPLLDPTLEQQQGNQNNINSELNGPYPPENYTSENQDLLEEFIENLFA